MEPSLQTFLEQASQPQIPEDIRRLARNHALDLNDITSPHPNAADCGKQLPSGILPLTSPNYRIPIPPHTASETEQVDYHNQLERALISLMDQYRNQKPKGMQPNHTRTLQLTRFMDLQTVYTCWYGGHLPAKKQQMLDGLNKLQQRVEEYITLPPAIAQHRPNLNELRLARHEPHAVVWTTQTATAPEQQTYQARDWVHHLALPGYTTEQDYQQKVGLVAVDYYLDAQKLYKPTVIEAHKNTYYFPGYQDEKQGRTAPFDSNQQAPWSRVDKKAGLLEYIHTNLTLADTQPQLRYIGDF